MQGVTADQIKEYFETLGITLPDFMYECIAEKVNSIIECMIEAGYSDCDVTMALLIASGLIGIGMGARKVKSHKADIVSQSYEYDSIEDLQKILLNNLAMYDQNGCTDPVIPSTINTTFTFVTGGC